MENLLTYILQVNLLLALLFIGYAFLLKGMTFYTLNRIYFLLGSLYAFVYPFVDVKTWFAKREIVEAVYLPQFFPADMLLGSESPQALTLIDICIGAIGLVSMIFIFKFIVQLFSLLRIHSHSKDAIWNSFTFRNVLFPVVPFSFFDKIYLHKEQHQDAELQDIFAHETIHVRGHHTIDILLFEIILMVCWYNPFVWLMRKAVRQNLEFLTDQQVLDKGVDRQTYQYSLLHVAQQGAALDIGNQFNFKTLKKRIMMMNKKRSSKLELSKYAFLLPVLLIAGMSFTVSKAESGIESIVEIAKDTPLDVPLILKSDPTKDEILPIKKTLFHDRDGHSINDSVGYVLDDKLVSIEELKSLQARDIETIIINTNNELTEKFGKKSLVNIKTKKYAGTLGTPSQFTEFIIKEQDGLIVKGGAIKSQTRNNEKQRIVEISGLSFHTYSPSQKDTTKQITINSDQIRRVKNRNEIDPNKNFVYIYDHNVISKEKFYKIPEKELNSISVGLGQSILQGRYSDQISNRNDYDGFVSASSSAELARLEQERKKALIIVDGKEAPAEYDINALSPDNIESISVLKNENATLLYGDKGKDGVIVIKTKKGNTSSANSEVKDSGSFFRVDDNDSDTKSRRLKIGDSASLNKNLMITLPNNSMIIVRGKAVSTDKKPLIIVDGVEKDLNFDIHSLDQDNIASISVLKNQSAAAIYGDKGKNGVLNITTKDNPSKEIVIRGYTTKSDKKDANNTKTNSSLKEVVVKGYSVNSAKKDSIK